MKIMNEWIKPSYNDKKDWHHYNFQFILHKKVHSLICYFSPVSQDKGNKQNSRNLPTYGIYHCHCQWDGGPLRVTQVKKIWNDFELHFFYELYEIKTELPDDMHALLFELHYVYGRGL